MKEKIEKLLKSHLKRKMTITTATLIAFLLSSNLVMASQYYGVGNGKIVRNILETWKGERNYLGAAGLFEISETNIVNRLKDESNFRLLPEVNRSFINEGAIYYLTNDGTGKIENRGWIENLNSSTKNNEIENRGVIWNFASKGNIANKGYIDKIEKVNNIVNDGYIWELKENKNITNNGIIREVYNGTHIADIGEIKNNGIINFEESAYNAIEKNKIKNKGIVLVNDIFQEKEGNSSTIENYNNKAIPNSIDKKILNAYNGKIENDLKVENNSILNMYKGTIATNKKISIDNSTVNIEEVIHNGGLELEFKNNSKIGRLYLQPNNSSNDKINNITMDNTTEVARIGIPGDIEAINLVQNESNKDKVLRINRFMTDANKNVNTYISTNVDLLEYSRLGNITVKKDGRLTIAKNALSWNGKSNSLEYHKKDITIEKDGKIIIGIDPYNIGQIEYLGAGNNLTESVIGQVDTTDPNLRLAKDKLTIDADSLLHDVVILDGEEINYVGIGKRKLRNRYKFVEDLNLAKPEPDPKPLPKPEPISGESESILKNGEKITYEVGEKEIIGTNFNGAEYATKYLDKTGLVKISETNIINRLKDKSNFILLSEVKKDFINEGAIYYLTNDGTGKIENRGWIGNLNSSTKNNEIENRGVIGNFASKGNIANKGSISSIDKVNNIVNDGYIRGLKENKNITNNGIIEVLYNSTHIADIGEIKNNGIINFEESTYNAINAIDLNKIENKGIVLADGNLKLKAVNTSEIENYNNKAIPSSIDNKILNAYKEGKIESDLAVKNNSILNMLEGEIAANKKISIDNSTVNMRYVRYKDGLELEFKNNSKIGTLHLLNYGSHVLTDGSHVLTDGSHVLINNNKINNLTIDNTTEVGSINISGDITAINLVPNTDIANKNKVLRINGFGTDSSANTYISTNVDLLGYSYLGNITVKEGGRLTIAKDALEYNGKEGSTFYKKDIKIEGNGKIIIGIDPYNIGETEKLGDGNNLTESVIGQVDTTDPNLRKPQIELNLLADSRLHGIVVLDARKLKYQKYENNSWIEYEADVRNEYKVVEELNLPKPEEPKPDNEGGTPNPPSGGTTNPPSGGTPNPPSGGTTNPPSGGTPNPPSGGTTNPPSGGTPNPPSGGTPNPPSGGTTNPPSGGTTNPPSGGTPNPPSGGTPNPPSGGTANPPSGANPPSSVPTDYPELNLVYQSLQKAGGVKYLKVGNDKQLFGLYEYLRDMYANSPYALSAETSFRNLAMLRDNAYLDLKPNLNKWAVMGGLSHSDRENKFKHELGTTEADTITTGAYAKGEYGLKEDTTLGLILGGTNSKSDLLTGKVKGSSFYLGAYAKKYVNNFKFTLGTGIDLGEYKVNRNAIGYAGIIETEKYSAKQKNRAFDLYAEARYSKDLGNNFYLEPNFNLAYSRVRQGGATENDGKINLDIKSKTFNQTTAALGLDLKKVLLNGNTSHSFALGTAYERVLSGAKENTLRASVVGGSGSGFDILVPEKEKGRTSIGAEYKLENKVGILFNLKMDYGFKHGSDKKDIRFSTGLGYKF